MHQNAEDQKHQFPLEVVSTVLTNFYVDDCLHSLPSSSEAIMHMDDLHKLTFKEGFNLTKWISNDREVLESIPVEDRAKGIKECYATKCNSDAKCNNFWCKI